MNKNISRAFLQISTGVATCLTLGAGKVMAFTVREGAEAAKADDMPRDLFGPTGALTKISNIVLFIVGILSVIMLIWGGIRYVISGGDSKKVTDAKNTILYAIIGLIIAVMAFAIVNFVLGALGVDSGTTTETIEQSSSILINMLG